MDDDRIKVNQTVTSSQEAEAQAMAVVLHTDDLPGALWSGYFFQKLTHHVSFGLEESLLRCK